MLGVIVFAASFLSLFTATLMFPVVPPGQILCEVIGNSEADILVAGVSGELLVAGMINGLVWGVIIAVFYSYVQGPSRGKVNLPVWVPGYTTSRSSRIAHKQSSEASLQSINPAQGVEVIEGIGSNYGRKLRKLGIKTVNDLIVVGSTGAGRNYLAKKIGVTPATVLVWVQQAEAHR